MKKANKTNILYLIQKRLDIVHEIAKYKWNNAIDIVDEKREKYQIEELLEISKPYNIKREKIIYFIKYQIYLAKNLQINLFKDFEKQKIKKFKNVKNLEKVLRLEIDQINKLLIEEFCNIKNR
jgi:chorismate mutase-like protein